MRTYLFFVFSMLLVCAAGCDRREVTALSQERDQLKQKVATQERELRAIRVELDTFKQTDNYYYQKAVNLRTSGEFDLSTKWLREMIERFPQSSLKNDAEDLKKRNKDDSLKKLVTSAEDLRAQGDFAGSNGEVKKILERYPKSAETARVRKLESENERSLAEAAERSMRASAQLELVDWNWGQSSTSHVTAKGQIKNISSRSISSVKALVTWYDKNEGFITSDSSLIEYNPILPGQISPFSVIESYNPAMVRASVEFMESRGTQLEYIREQEGEEVVLRANKSREGHSGPESGF